MSAVSERGSGTRPRDMNENLRAIDRIDDRGNIREHLTNDGKRTLCGLNLHMTQDAGENAKCQRCTRALERIGRSNAWRPER